MHDKITAALTKMSITSIVMNWDLQTFLFNASKVRQDKISPIHPTICSKTIGYCSLHT